MDREMFPYECTACVLVFGVETVFEGQSEIVCPYCHPMYTSRMQERPLQR